MCAPQDLLYELSEAIDLLIQSGRTIDANRIDGWRVDVGYPEDRDEAERRLGRAKTTYSNRDRETDRWQVYC